MIRIPLTIILLSNGALTIHDAMYNHIGNGDDKWGVDVGWRTRHP